MNPNRKRRYERRIVRLLVPLDVEVTIDVTNPGVVAPVSAELAGTLSDDRLRAAAIEHFVDGGSER